jgi:Ca2+-binding RTX toxin-like protein
MSRGFPWRKSLCLSAVILAVCATAAVAYSNTDYFYGAKGVSSLNESNVAANCHIWGLDLTHNLTGCLGNNLIVADGQCPPGTVNGDNDNYCEITINPSDPGDTLRGGAGDNIIIGGGGPNTIYGGTGSNGVYTGPASNTYYGGNAGDIVYASEGNGTLNMGTGENLVYASSSGVYHVICTGKNDYVYIEPQDTTKNCAHVQQIKNNGSARDVSSLVSAMSAKTHKNLSKLISHKRKSRKHSSKKHTRSSHKG